MYQIKKKIEIAYLEDFKLKVNQLTFSKTGKDLITNIKDKIAFYNLENDKKAIWEYIHNNYYKILIAIPEELYKINDAISNKWQQLKCVTERKIKEEELLKIKGKHNVKSKRDKLDNEIKKLKEKETLFLNEMSNIFEIFYKEFRSKHGYWLSQLLDVKVCPYCNRNYTFTLEKIKGTKIRGTRPEFDHFFPQSKYPYFAVSFYNLIPSCHICNSNLKGDIDFNINSHFHPYDKNGIEYFKFEIKPLTKEAKNNLKVKVNTFKQYNAKGKKHNEYDRLSLFYGGKEFEIKIKEKEGLDAENIQKVHNMNNTFRIEDIYNEHKDLVCDIIKTAIIYNETYIEDLYKQFKGDLFKNEADVKKFIFYNYPTNDGGENRPFSKLTEDVMEQFGIKY